MECRPLDITLISAKELKDVNLFTKMDVYAVVSIQGDLFDSKQKQKTHVDKDSGPNPNWNLAMKFTVPEESLRQNRLFLKIEIKSHRSLSDRAVGEVHVPIKELLDSFRGDGERVDRKYASYSVRTPSGKNKGVLNFSYKFGDKFTAPAMAKNLAEEPVMAYPAPAGYMGGASSAYPPLGVYPPPPPHGVTDKTQTAAYSYPYPYAPPPPQHGYGGYPPAPAGYGGYNQGYPPAGAGYGGYTAVVPPQKQPKKSGAGKMALGLGAGLLGGLLVGDMISDVADMSSYDDGFGDGFDF